MENLNPTTRELIFEKILSLQHDIEFLNSMIDRMDLEYHQMKYIEIDMLKKQLDQYKQILFNNSIELWTNYLFSGSS